MELMQTIAGLPLLPHALGDIESKAILKQLPKAHAALAELKGVEQTAQQTTLLIGEIKTLMQTSKEKLRRELPKIYSQDLINNLFKHPYTKVEFVMEDLLVHRSTAVRYLDALVKSQILSKYKLGKDNYYFNTALYRLLDGVGERLMTGKPL